MSPVAGLWANEYGSLMSLVVEDNKVSGVYQSSTGSTGQYEVSGYQLGTAATATQGQPVALAIDWHSVGKGTADPSWNWSSSLCGQISMQGQEEVLTLSHLLVASSDFAGLAAQGTYVDKLVYRRPGRMQRAVPTGATAIASSVDNPLTGTWITPDGTGLNLWVEATKEGRVGRVQGFLINAEGQTQVVGFTDIKAMASGLVLQSLALSTAHSSHVQSLCGTLQMQDQTLALAVMTSAPTAPGQTYVQTRLTALVFKRG